MQAESALQTAQAAGAEDFAPEAFKAAAEAMADARSKNERKDFEGARAAAVDATARANMARDQVESGKQKIKGEAEAGLTALMEEWKGIDRAISKTTLQGTDKEKMDMLRNGIETMIGDIKYLSDAGDYAGALAGVRSARGKIGQVTALLEAHTGH